MDRQAWRAMLPARVIYDVGDMTAEISFAPLAAAETVRDRACHVEGHEPWLAHLVIGDEHFDNGSALFCVRAPTADVVRVDVELDEPESFVQSSVEQFARSLAVAVRWSSTKRADQWEASLDELADALRAVDAAALASPRRWWPLLLAEARTVTPGALTFRELPPLRL